MTNRRSPRAPCGRILAAALFSPYPGLFVEDAFYPSNHAGAQLHLDPMGVVGGPGQYAVDGPLGEAAGALVLFLNDRDAHLRPDMIPVSSVHASIIPYSLQRLKCLEPAEHVCAGRHVPPGHTL